MIPFCTLRQNCGFLRETPQSSPVIKVAILKVRDAGSNPWSSRFTLGAHISISHAAGKFHVFEDVAYSGLSHFHSFKLELFYFA